MDRASGGGSGPTNAPPTHQRIADLEDASFASVELTTDCSPAESAALDSTELRRRGLDDEASVEIEELVDEIRELEDGQHDNASTAQVLDEDDDETGQHRPNVFVVGADQRGPLKHSVVMVCDVSKFLTPVGLLKTIISISCVVSLSCICYTDYQTLPLSAYARLHIFILTFAFLTVLLIFFIEITTLTFIFPIHWDYWNAVIHFVLCLLLNGSSSLVIHALFSNESRMSHLDRTMELIIVSGVSGYFCALMCVLTSAIACCCYDHHLALPWKDHPEGVMMLR